MARRGGRVGAVSNKVTILLSSRTDLAAEMRKHEIDVLSRELHIAKQHGMTGPGKLVEAVHRDRQTRANRVEMDVAHQLEKIFVLLHERVLESILEEMPRW